MRELQRSAGNRAVARVIGGRGEMPVVARLAAAHADLFDYDDMADKIFTAVDGIGTDEQAVFHVLERLQRDAPAITRLEAAYRTRHQADLVAALQDELSGSELAYALELVNRGGGGTTAVGAAPTSDAQHDAAAHRIRDAVEGIGTDEEAVYAALMGYGRNSGLVARLKERYLDLYHEDLRARIEDEFSGDELQHVQYLMGEAALEETELSPAAAARLFTVMSGLTFTDSTGSRVPVPYHYPVDGCYARAQMMAEVMTQAGIASERVFATSTVPLNPLVVRSPYSADQPAAAPPATLWGYHVAPIVRVRTAGGLVENVIDPSTQPGPVPVDTWLSTMGVAAGTYNRFTHAELTAHLASPPPAGGEKNVWTTDRNTMFPNDAPASDSRRADAELANLNPRMTGYAQLARVHEIAAAVRAQLALPGATAASVIAAIRAGEPSARLMLWPQFPQLHGDAVARFPADAPAIDAATGP